jgi:hypothetical protein
LKPIKNYLSKLGKQLFKGIEYDGEYSKNLAVVLGKGPYIVKDTPKRISGGKIVVDSIVYIVVGDIHYLISVGDYILRSTHDDTIVVVLKETISSLYKELKETGDDMTKAIVDKNNVSYNQPDPAPLSIMTGRLKSENLPDIYLLDNKTILMQPFVTATTGEINLPATRLDKTISDVELDLVYLSLIPTSLYKTKKITTDRPMSENEQELYELIAGTCLAFYCNYLRDADCSAYFTAMIRKHLTALESTGQTPVKFNWGEARKILSFICDHNTRAEYAVKSLSTSLVKTFPNHQLLFEYTSVK